MTFLILTLLFHTFVDSSPYVPEKIPTDFPIQVQLATSSSCETHTAAQCDWWGDVSLKY